MKLLLLLRFTHQVATQTLTITSLSAYSSLRTCAQPCVNTQGFPANLRCGPRYLDSCVYRRDLASSASSFITYCVMSLCNSLTVDVNSAVALYNEYCPRTELPDPATTEKTTSKTTRVPPTTTVSASPGSTFRTSTATSKSLSVSLIEDKDSASIVHVTKGEAHLQPPYCYPPQSLTMARRQVP